MTGDPYNRHSSESLLGRTLSPTVESSGYMFSSAPSQQSPPNPANMDFPLPPPQYQDHFNRFQTASFSNHSPVTNNVTPFQFSLPNLNNAGSSFVFTPQLPTSPQLNQSTSVVHFPFSNQAFSSQLNQFSIQKPNTNFFGEDFDGDFCTPNKMRESMRCKRKPDLIDLPPSKQHITEEKMAESMSRLHICSETPVSSSEPQEKRMQRLYMCDEMRRLQAESIIPHQILSKISRPCTALIPWTPPPVALAGAREASGSGINDSDNNNNNNDDEVDNYTSDSDKSVLEIEVEPNPNLPPNMDMDL